MPEQFSPDSLKKFQHWMQWVYLGLLAIGIAALMSANLGRARRVAVVEGEPSPSQVIAPFDKSFESTFRTVRERELAVAQVPDQFTAIDRLIGSDQIDLAEQMFAFVAVVRADGSAESSWKLDTLQAIEIVDVSPETAQNLLSLSDSSLATVRQQTSIIIGDIMRNDVKEGDLPSVDRVVESAIPLGLTGSAEETVLLELVPQLITPNVFFDEAKTEQLRTEAFDEAVPVNVSVQQGETILGEGEIVSADDLELLSEYGLLQDGFNWGNLFRNTLAAILASIVIALYIDRYPQTISNRHRYWAWLLAFMLTFTAFAVSIIPRQPFNYIFPIAAFAILAGIIFDVRFAFLLALVNAGIISLVADNSLEMAFYALVGTMLAIFTLRPAQRLTDYFRAGILVALGNLLVITLFNLSNNNFDPRDFLILSGLSLANGMIVASIVVAGLYLTGALFRIVTTLQLHDLSRFDQPLLQELVRRAPGTYHHSVMVANLAEKACNEVGADSLLARVGAFYHDIGKMPQSQFFTENQEGINPHDQIEPAVSADIIIGHVTEGIIQARKYGLPDRLQNFILEHHGDQILKPFYLKALEHAESLGEPVDSIDESAFQYPGPRPQSRETGIVMLADAVEATSKAVQPNNEEAIYNLVRRIMDDMIAKDQLDDCGLTLRDLHKIRDSFVQTLKGRYHVRVKYAGNESLEALNTPAQEIPADADPESVPLPTNSVPTIIRPKNPLDV